MPVPTIPIPVAALCALLVGIFFYYIGKRSANRVPDPEPKMKSGGKLPLQQPEKLNWDGLLEPVRIIDWERPGTTDFVVRVEFNDGSIHVMRGFSEYWRHFPSGAKCSRQMNAWMKEKYVVIEWEISDGPRKMKVVRDVMES